MPRRDGTGPVGEGSMTGRGLGACKGSNGMRQSAGLGLGLGCRRGFGLGLRRRNAIHRVSSKELLQDQKDLLQKWIQIIEKQLENY